MQRLNNAARENSRLQSFKFFGISCTAPEMEIIPKLFYARREFKKSFQTEISAAVPEQSFHAIVNLHVKEINPSSSFDAKSLSFCFQECCILTNTFKPKICAFVQNWENYVIEQHRDLPYSGRKNDNNILSLNLQNIVRDFDSKESPWFDDTLKSFKIRQKLGASALDKPAAVDAREGGWKVHQIQSSVPWSLVETMLWHVTIFKLVKLHQGILLNKKPCEIIIGDAELWFNVVEELLVQDLINQLDFKEFFWRQFYLELLFGIDICFWYLKLVFGLLIWNWHLELVFGIGIWN